MADKQQQGINAAPTPGAALTTGLPRTDAAGAGTANAPATIAEYKKSQARVRELIEKRRLLDRRLVRNPPPPSLT